MQTLSPYDLCMVYILEIISLKNISKYPGKSGLTTIVTREILIYFSDLGENE